MSKPVNHWQLLAERWHLVGPPLRPDAADQRVYNELIQCWEAEHPDHKTPSALILGVTPELVQLQWPAGTSLKALDASSEMIAAVWQGQADKAFIGSWMQTPFAAGSQDMIFLDGGFGVQRYPDNQLQLLQEVERLLTPGGIFAVRLFAPAGRTGSLEDVRQDLASGLIRSLDELKLRLWGALHSDLASGVSPSDVVAQIDLLAQSPGLVAGAPGWHPQHLETLALHRHSRATYHLINEVELQDLVKGLPGLAVQSVVFPENRFGSSCPVVCLRRNHGY